MKVVAYLRVSSRKQGASGLGLEAQRDAIASWAEREGHEIVDCYIEVESGRKSRRPQVAKAILAASDRDATLVVAKLDRLARDVAFIVKLRESEVPFLALDLPETENPLFLYITAALAEYEGERIRQRQRAAYDRRRARGDKLGRPENLRRNAGGAEAVREAARQDYAKITGYCQVLRERGDSYRKIAARLNAEGHRTRGRRPFDDRTVRRILARAA